MAEITLAYHSKTGAILALATGEDRELLKTVAEDEELLRDHNLADTSELKTLVTDMDIEKLALSDLFVENGEVVPRYSIVLATDASDEKNPNGVPEIAGDGKSQCEITATVMTADGKVKKDFAGVIAFASKRGRLSTRNGVVSAKGGVAKIKLTSAAETVPPFSIVASSPGCRPGVTRLEFY